MSITKLFCLLLVSITALSGCYTVRYVVSEVPEEEEEDKSAPDGFALQEGDDWYVVIKPAKATIFLTQKNGQTTGRLILAYNSGLLTSKEERRFSLKESAQPWHEFVWTRTGESATGQLVNEQGQEVLSFACTGVVEGGSLSCQKTPDAPLREVPAPPSGDAASAQATLAPSPPDAPPGGAPDETSGLDKEGFQQLINELRAGDKKEAVSYGECADKMATFWATNENAPTSAGHEFGKSTLASRAKELGCSSPLMENVAWPVEGTAEEIFTQWKTSKKGHRENMLKAGIKQIGLHCVNTPLSSSGHFCVLVGTG